MIQLIMHKSKNSLHSLNIEKICIDALQDLAESRIAKHAILSNLCMNMKYTI